MTSERGSGRPLHQRLDLGAAPELVLISLDEEPRRAAGVQEGRVRDHGEREAQREQRAHARVAAARAQGHGGPEGEAARDEGKAGEPARRLVERRADVVLLAAPVVVDAFAPAHARGS